MEQIYQIKKAGKVLFTGTADECFCRLLDIQPQSTHWAQKYGGYSIVAGPEATKEEQEPRIEGRLL